MGVGSGTEKYVSITGSSRFAVVFVPAGADSEHGSHVESVSDGGEFAAGMRLSRSIYQLIRKGTLKTVMSETRRMLIPASELARVLSE
jgi:enterochelin esterase-like enzyme